MTFDMTKKNKSVKANSSQVNTSWLNSTVSEYFLVTRDFQMIKIFVYSLVAHSCVLCWSGTNSDDYGFFKTALSRTSCVLYRSGQYFSIWGSCKIAFSHISWSEAKPFSSLFQLNLQTFVGSCANQVLSCPGFYTKTHF